MKLPEFKYHPDPISTGSVEASDETCECCQSARGYICTSIIYARDDIDNICPWCVADGSAAKKFNGTFVDDYPLENAGISASIISEVCERTPSFNSWQQEVWQHHCNDACEYHGNPSKEELKELSGKDLELFLSKEMIDEYEWEDIIENYQEFGNPAVYKFKCKHCSKHLYYTDYL